MSFGGIAQLVRAPASHAGGHRFEPRCLHQKTAVLVRGRPFFLLHRGSKDERHRATVRWTVVTASDQAPAGARVEPRCLHHEKSTSSEVLFSMKRTLRCMKSEAGLCPMKRGFAARRGTGASLHANAASASRKPTGFRFTFADGKRFIRIKWRDFCKGLSHSNGEKCLHLFQ